MSSFGEGEAFLSTLWACSTRRSGRSVCAVSVDRSRRLVLLGIGLAVLPNPSLTAEAGNERGTIADKPETKYPDFQVTESGLQYRDVRVGGGPSPNVGDRVVVDWEGYTLGHQGRPFAAKNKVKGGDFEGDQDFCRWVQGQHTVIPALEDAVSSMKQGGVRQVVFQGSGQLGYPASDPKHEKVGPKPKTFAGMQRLDFVLTSKGYVDSTLLINVELIRIDRPGERGFRG
ncbi:hypothetical protein NDN08_007359 [Rhodosorus marinus]|uniref:PPIase FKBP-type domain-containing protein n=1 Tax=Rhodosorus marinus TaxID=101924 RepID=A0AAV8UG96_9RHOD|nr:hypothetical protein NDN08_007359 [Rhodosorus marinus]